MQLKVLVVEDSTLAQRMTESILLDLGCAVDVTTTAENGLKMLKKNIYSIIFLDLGLPGMSGIDMAKKIRQYEKKKNNAPIPIIGQSARIDAENKKLCSNAGIQELLPKPLIANKIIELLNKYIACHAKPFSASQKTSKRHIHNQYVIDKALFNTITHNDPETQASFIALTKQLLETDLVSFQETYKGKNWKQLLFLTHKLRGSFACIAAMRLEEAFGHLEEYLCENIPPHAEKIQLLYNSIAMEIEILKKELDQLLSTT